MYHTDGDFGQVRLLEPLWPQGMPEAVACFSCAGWHRCNSRYRIDRPRGIDQYLLLITVGGEGCLETGGEPTPLPPGSLAVIPPWRGASYYTPEGGIWEFYWLHPVGEAAQRLMDYVLAQLTGPAPLLSVDPRPYAEGIERLLRLREDPREAAEARASSITAALFYRLLEDAAGAGEWGRVSGPVIRYMEEHYAERLTLETLAARAYLSPAHLIRQFKKETGYTPHEYLNRLRISRAGQLLRFTDKTVGAVAREVGFRQSSRFIQLYKEINGVTPGRERG